MGTFSQYGVGGFGGNAIGMNEAYYGTGAIGLYKTMEESSMNNRAIFEHVLGCDFMETMSYQGYVSESTYEAINEASGESIFGKVISFFKKLGEKIKAIIQGVMDKLTSVITTDGKKLVNKFKKQIAEKLNTGVYDPDKFSYKWCKVKDGKDGNDGVINAENLAAKKGSVADKILKCETPSSLENKVYQSKSIKDILGTSTDSIAIVNPDTPNGTMYGYKRSADSYASITSNIPDAAKKSRAKAIDNFNKEEKYKDARTPINSSDLADYKDAILSKFVSGTDSSSFAKDMDEAIFDDEDTEEGFDSNIYAKCIAILSDTKAISGLEKEKRLVDKDINDIIKEAQKCEKEMAKLSRTKDQYSVAAALARTKATTVVSMGNVCNSCCTMVYAAYIAAVKKNIKQARAAWVKAATYTKKTSKNESAYLEALVEVSNYEVDEMMPEF